MSNNRQRFLGTTVCLPWHLDVTLRDECLASPNLARRLADRRRKASSASASGNSIEFHSRDDGGVFGETQLGEIFALQMKCDGLAYVRAGLIQSVPLGDNRKIHAFGDILCFPF